MKRTHAVVGVLVLLIAATSATSAEGLSAFPGAEGFGAGSIGGRGGQVIKVTNLHARGPGSLQAASSAEGPRIVVFGVSGVISGDVVIEHGPDAKDEFDHSQTMESGYTAIESYYHELAKEKPHRVRPHPRPTDECRRKEGASASCT